MGEYATVNGERVKLGTCEAMYYLRADDVPRVSGHSAFADNGYKDWALFRFPWPWEDDVEPGAYEGAWGRGLTVWGASVPEGIDHGIVQLTHRNCYLVSPRWGRPQHVVDWKRFRAPLRLRDGIDIAALLPNEYGMRLEAVRDIKSPSLRALVEEQST